MSKLEKFYIKLIKGHSDKNIDFKELCNFLKHLGFHERIKSSHYIFAKDGVEEIINIQPENNKAKTYQIRQIRRIIIEYKLWRNINE